MYREAAILGLLASGLKNVTNYGRETAFSRKSKTQPQRCAYELTSCSCEANEIRLVARLVQSGWVTSARAGNSPSRIYCWIVCKQVYRCKYFRNAILSFKTHLPNALNRATISVRDSLKMGSASMCGLSHNPLSVARLSFSE